MAKYSKHYFQNDTFTVANNDMSVFGSTGGNEVLEIGSTVTGVVVDGNLESVNLAGSLSNYTFQNDAARGVLVLNAAGNVVASFASINNTAGTVVKFTDGSANLKQDANTGAFTLGSQTVSTTAGAITTASLGATFDTTNKSTILSSGGNGGNGGNNGGTSNGTTFTLTASVDNFVGSAADDTFIGSDALGATARSLGALDVIDGGAGNNTLLLADAQTAGTDNFSFNSATIKNVQTFNVATNGSFDVAANTGLSLKGFTGLTTANLKAAGTDNSFILASNTTDVNLTVAGSAQAKVTGGKAVSVVADTGLVTVAGDALTSVTIKGGATTSSITNTVSGASNTGTTLTSVTLDGIATGTAAASGDALANVTIKNQTTALATTITNAKSTTLTVNADAAGYTAAGAAFAGVTIAAGAAATSITLNAVSKSNVAVSGALVTNLNITGTGSLTLSAPITTATKIDASAAIGSLTLGVLNAATVSVTGGSGNDSLTTSATTKSTIDTGAGDDVVTLAAAVPVGSLIKLGAGNDKLLVAGGSITGATLTSTSTIDGGDGVDSIAASIINASNAALFTNFDAIDLSGIQATALDLNLVTASAITSLTLSGRVAGGGPYSTGVTNLNTGIGLTVSGLNDDQGIGTTTGVTSIAVKDADTSTTNSFTVTFAGAEATTAPTAANVSAGEVKLNEIESISLVSGGSTNTWNSIGLTDNKLKTVAISGDKNLDLSFIGTNGTNTALAAGGAVNLIDGSTATGKLSINTTNVTADDKSGIGLTVKGGTANDTITLAQKATVYAGAGDDKIIAAASGGAFTGGDGKDTFDVTLATATSATEVASVFVTITDLTAGDKIDFGTTAIGAFTTTKVALGSSVTSLDLALAAATGAVNTTQWFQYGGYTYVVSNDADLAFDAGDTVVRITGSVDLSNSLFAATVLTVV